MAGHRRFPCTVSHAPFGWVCNLHLALCCEAIAFKSSFAGGPKRGIFFDAPYKEFLMRQSHNRQANLSCRQFFWPHPWMRLVCYRRGKPLSSLFVFPMEQATSDRHQFRLG
jgi:hypothetical protein